MITLRASDIFYHFFCIVLYSVSFYVGNILTLDKVSPISSNVPGVTIEAKSMFVDKWITLRGYGEYLLIYLYMVNTYLLILHVIYQVPIEEVYLHFYIQYLYLWNKDVWTSCSYHTGLVWNPKEKSKRKFIENQKCSKIKRFTVK